MNKKSPTGCRPDQLFGFWLMAPDILESYRARALAVDFDTLAKMNAENPLIDSHSPPIKPYSIEDGVAVIEISGPTSKYPTSFQGIVGGTSTLLVEKALKMAEADEEVKSIMLHMDSAPGGTVAGAYELADRIKEVRKTKPVYAHGDDVMASAAYMFASCCDHATANRTATVGSIGTITQIVDTSAKMEKEGIKVIPIAAGKFKGTGMTGAPVKEEHIQEIQQRIDSMNELFISEVASGRRMSKTDIRKMEARCYIGEDAKKAGLIDGVCSFETALKVLQNKQQKAEPSGNLGFQNSAAPKLERKFHMDLLQAIREVFGAAEMTEEQAVAAVKKSKADTASASTSLTAATAETERLKTEVTRLSAFAPKAVDPEMLKDRAEICIGKIDIAVGKGDMPVVIADKLKKAVMKDGKPDAFMLASVESLGGRPIEFVTSLFAGEKMGGPVTGSVTGTQLLQRQVPGEITDPTEAKQIAEGDRIAASIAEKSKLRREMAQR